MSTLTNIGWADSTWPIIAGCTYESPGCSNCWAVRDSWRLAHNPNNPVREAFAGVVEKKAISGKLVWTGVVRPLPMRLDWPLKWRKPKKIFVCSQSDLFHPEVPFLFIAAAFGVMAMAPQHTFQVLTKHPRRAIEFFSWVDAEQGGALMACLWYARKAIGADLATRFDPYPDNLPAWPLENVWFGVTVEDRDRAHERLPLLEKIPATIRWVSAEPLLEAISLAPWMKFIDWVVVGGESAQTRAVTRPFDLGWARLLLRDCRTFGKAFFMKQLGTKPIPAAPPGAVTVMALGLPVPPGKSSRYKFHEPEHWPEDLRVQEFPCVKAAT